MRSFNYSEIKQQKWDSALLTPLAAYETPKALDRICWERLR